MRIAFTTLGCKINQYETDLMRQEFVSRGNTIVPFDAEADVYVVNTCTVTAKSDSKGLVEKLNAGKVDWLTFCSPSSVRGFFEQIPADVVKSSKVKTVSIGPVTSERIAKLGVKIDLEAVGHTIDGVIAELKRFYTRSL